jgi:hypothetical protein
VLKRKLKLLLVSGIESRIYPRDARKAKEKEFAKEAITSVVICTLSLVPTFI